MLTQSSPQLLEAAAIVGALMPTVVAVINQSRWPRWGRSLAAVLLCAVAGTLTAAVSGEFAGRTLAESVSVVVAAALATYHLWWHRSGITTAIEDATSRPVAARSTAARMPARPTTQPSER